ncbi:MAG: transposase [Verrucomicrobiaceae bacterium]|nr:transposase [Verrucomicrobiaceae bacterium]
MRLIGHLYNIEARLREQRASGKLRAVIRNSESRPIIERIGTILRHWKRKGRHFPTSQMGKAVDYTLTLWHGLRVFIEEGRIELDNNEVENAIRPTAVGKKNWLFIGDAEAGERSAIVFTVIEACRRRGVDPFEYLREVFTQMPTMAANDYPSLAPDAWLKKRKLPKPSSKAPAVIDASNPQRHCA